MPTPLAIQARSLPATHIEASWPLIGNSSRFFGRSPCLLLVLLARLSSRILRCYATATSLIRGWAFTCRSVAGLYMRLPSAWNNEGCTLRPHARLQCWRVGGRTSSHTACCTMVATPRNSRKRSKFCREQIWGKLNSDAVSFSAMAFTAAEKQSCGLQLDGFHPP